MTNIYWYKQADKPLFPDVLWSRPQNKKLARKLLIVGGHSHAFQNVANSFRLALQAGAGECKVALPSSLRKIVGNTIEEVVYLPKTPSGGIARSALNDLHEYIGWADGLLLPGDIGRDSETTIALEHLLAEEQIPLAAANDALDIYISQPDKLLTRKSTLIIASLAQLQKMLVALKYKQPITSRMSLIQLIDLLHNLTLEYPCPIISQHQQSLIVASNGQVSTTKTKVGKSWVVPQAVRSTVFWLQNPGSEFEALTTSVWAETEKTNQL